MALPSSVLGGTDSASYFAHSPGVGIAHVVEIGVGVGVGLGVAVPIESGLALGTGRSRGRLTEDVVVESHQ